MNYGNQYTGPKGAVLLALKQARKVMGAANTVILVDNEGKPQECWRNKHYRINVCAIIGPGVVSGMKVESVILAEIGMGRSYPYSKAYGISHADGHRTNGSDTRNKVCAMDEVRIKNVWPTLTNILIEDAWSKIKKWKNPFSTFTHYHKTKHVLTSRGPRYSVSFKDTLLCAAVLQSELHNRPIPLREDARRIAHMIRTNLAPYQNRLFSRDWVEKEGAKKPGMGLDFILGYVDQNFRRLLPHHQWLVWEYLKKHHCADLFEGILKNKKISLDEGRRWDEIFLSKQVPTIAHKSGVSVWCVPFEQVGPLNNRNVKKRDRVLSFELILNSSFEQKRMELHGQELYRIPDRSKLVDPKVPF